MRDASATVNLDRARYDMLNSRRLILTPTQARLWLGMWSQEDYKEGQTCDEKHCLVQVNRT